MFHAPSQSITSFYCLWLHILYIYFIYFIFFILNIYTTHQANRSLSEKYSSKLTFGQFPVYMNGVLKMAGFSKQ